MAVGLHGFGKAGLPEHPLCDAPQLGAQDPRTELAVTGSLALGFALRRACGSASPVTFAAAWGTGACPDFQNLERSWEA